MTISVKQATLSQPCASIGWHFKINQIKDGAAPSSITVFWSDGTSAVVDLSPPITQNTAHYIAAPKPNGSTITNATAEIYQGWGGHFNLSSCKAPTTPPPTSSTSDTPPAASTSPFVPGAGETGDTPPGVGFPMRQVLIGLAVAMLGAAGVTTFQVLRRRGSHT